MFLVRALHNVFHHNNPSYSPDSSVPLVPSRPFPLTHLRAGLGERLTQLCLLVPGTLGPNRGALQTQTRLLAAEPAAPSRREADHIAERAAVVTAHDEHASGVCDRRVPIPGEVVREVRRLSEGVPKVTCRVVGEE